MNLRLPAFRKAMALPAAAVVSIAIATSSFAMDKPSKTDIEAAVSDKTYQGSMLDNGFAEYYDAEGNIRGKDYSGKWRAEDGVMCFQYGEDPETCWDVRLEGPAMTMYKNGAVDGNGILVPGNPQKF